MPNRVLNENRARWIRVPRFFVENLPSAEREGTGNKLLSVSGGMPVWVSACCIPAGWRPAGCTACHCSRWTTVRRVASPAIAHAGPQSGELHRLPLLTLDHSPASCTACRCSRWTTVRRVALLQARNRRLHAILLDWKMNASDRAGRSATSPGQRTRSLRHRGYPWSLSAPAMSWTQSSA